MNLANPIRKMCVCFPKVASSKNDVILGTLLGTNISLSKELLKMMFLFPRWDILLSLEGIHWK